MSARIRCGLFAACLSLLALAAAQPAWAAAPVALTGPAGHIGADHAQLSGTVDPEGEETKFWFEWGPTAAYGHKAPVPFVPEGETQAEGEARQEFQELISAGSGSESSSYRQGIGALEAQTTYHFRIVAENASGTSEGADETFTTPAPPAPQSCANEARRSEQHANFLPDCRAYEMVSPPDKNGANIVPVSTRTRAAADGNAVGFTSLAAFADAVGTGISTDYIAKRSQSPQPGDSGWSTHAITPREKAVTFDAVTLAVFPTNYVGEFSPDLSWGPVASASPLTEDSSVANVMNLYLRTDLLSPGPGHYELLTACPFCLEKTPPAPLEPYELPADAENRPRLGGVSPDRSHALFQSGERLTKDTPANGATHLFEWDEGSVRLAGRRPPAGATECDDVTKAPECQKSEISYSGTGLGTATEVQRTAHALSDGSDGHSRVYFTRPTTADGTTLYSGTPPVSGQLYLREDGHYTSQLNASERTLADTTAPARFWEASADGERAFFTSKQALTDEAPYGGLYMYDATKPGSDPHNLTRLAPAFGVVGVSQDGSYVYFLASAEIVPGAPTTAGIYLWHEGAVSYVGPSNGLPIDSRTALASGLGLGIHPYLARVSPDGTHLLFPSDGDPGLLGYDHGSCGNADTRFRCVELYLYDATASTPTEPDLRCVSCRPDFTPPSGSASNEVRALDGAASGDIHENRSLSTDGRYAFFSTAEALVPGDTNGRSDAYEYDTQAEEVHLLSSGTSPTDSWFLDASADGRNAFIITAQPLLGWDHDSSYDLYDVRVGGGFPEPVPQAAPCGAAETCKGEVPPPPAPPGTGSTLAGPGNPQPKPTGCPKGRVKRKVHGKVRCVKRHHRKHPRSHGKKGGRR